MHRSSDEMNVEYSWQKKAFGGKSTHFSFQADLRIERKVHVNTSPFSIFALEGEESWAQFSALLQTVLCGAKQFLGASGTSNFK